MKGITIKDGGKEKWIYLSDAMRNGILGVYADHEYGGAFVRVCADENEAEEFFNREQKNGNIVYFNKFLSSETPRQVIIIE